MSNKQEELELLMQQSKYGLVGITETWWDKSHDWNVSIAGYNLFRRNRQNQKGGGVALYVRNDYTCEQVHDFDLGIEVESIWVKIKGGKRRSLL